MILGKNPITYFFHFLSIRNKFYPNSQPLEHVSWPPSGVIIFGGKTISRHVLLSCVMLDGLRDCNTGAADGTETLSEC